MTGNFVYYSGQFSVTGGQPGGNTFTTGSTVGKPIHVDLTRAVSVDVLARALRRARARAVCVR